MSLIIVISTGDFQICWNVLSLPFSEIESGKWNNIDTNKLITLNYQQFLLHSERKVMIYRKLII